MRKGTVERVLLAQLQSPSHEKLTPETLFTLPINKQGGVELISALLITRKGWSFGLREPLLQHEVDADRYNRMHGYPIRVYALRVSEEVYKTVQHPDNYSEALLPPHHYESHKYTLKPEQFELFGMIEIRPKRLCMFTNEDSPVVQAYRSFQRAEIDRLLQARKAKDGDAVNSEPNIEKYLADFPTGGCEVSRRNLVGVFESECHLQIGFNDDWQELEVYRLSSEKYCREFRDGKKRDFKSAEVLLNYASAQSSRTNADFWASPNTMRRTNIEDQVIQLGRNLGL